MPETLEYSRRSSLLSSRSRDTRTNPSEFVGTDVDVGLAIFRHLIRQLVKAPATLIANLRQEAIKELRRSLDPTRYITVLLEICLANRNNGGLDFAIDVLSQSGDLALEYALEFYKEDCRDWAQLPEIVSRSNDDVWFILLRSAARANINPMECMAVMRTCLQAGNRGIREAVVEGLYDLRTIEAKGLLSQIAGQDKDPFIRQLAQDNLRDLEALEQ